MYNKVTMNVPPGSQSLNRGETLDLPIELQGEIDDSYSLHLENLPKGVNADACEIRKGEHKAVCHLRASDDAELIDDCEITLVADGPGGMSEEKPIHLAVREKSSEGGQVTGTTQAGEITQRSPGGMTESGQRREQGGAGASGGQADFGKKNVEGKQGFGGQGGEEFGKQQGRQGQEGREQEAGGFGGSPQTGRGGEGVGGAGQSGRGQKRGGENAGRQKNNRPGQKKEFGGGSQGQAAGPAGGETNKPRDLPGKEKNVQENKPEGEDFEESAA